MGRGRYAIVLSIMLAGACSSDHPSQTHAKATHTEAEWLVERAEASGLDFVHFNGMSGEFYYPEIMAPGVALIDYDNDGDLDVFIVQGQLLGKGKRLDQAIF